MLSDNPDHILLSKMLIHSAELCTFEFPETLRLPRFRQACRVIDRLQRGHPRHRPRFHTNTHSPSPDSASVAIGGKGNLGS